LHDNVDVPRRWHRLAGPPAAELLAAAGIDSADRTAADVPPGVARATEIVRILALHPRLLLLDEPTAGLGPSESDALMRFVREAAAGAAVLVIEHDLRVVSATDRVVVMDQGRQLASGRPDAVRQDPKVIAAYLGPDLAPHGADERVAAGADDVDGAGKVRRGEAVEEHASRQRDIRQ
jgi:ABC-type branched-subunit amino acid transport system ATPase component